MGKYSNITIKRYKRILKHFGLSKVRSHKGHEMWWKEGLLKNVVFQTHIDPIPEFVIYSNIDTMRVSKQEFDEALRIFK